MNDAKQRKAARMKEWRERNKEHIREYSKKYYEEIQKPNRAAWYAKNKDRIKAQIYKWRKENPEATKKSRQQFLESHKEHLQEYEANRYQREREKMLARNAQWSKNNPLKRAEYERRRRARKRKTQVEKVDYAAILERDGLICHVCNDSVDTNDLSFDHVIPLARGGTHTIDNIRVAHKRCNFRKGTKIL